MKENQPDKQRANPQLEGEEKEQEGGLSMAPPKFSLTSGGGPIQKKDAEGVVQRQADPTAFPWYGVVQGAAAASLLSSAQIDPNNANAIAQIPTTTRILATGRTGDFLNVEYNGQTGFVHRNNVSELGEGVITHQNATEVQAHLRQRAKALIDIAHPNHREELEKAAFERFKSYQFERTVY
jgi:hypothetical protein